MQLFSGCFFLLFLVTFPVGLFFLWFCVWLGFCFSAKINFLCSTRGHNYNISLAWIKAIWEWFSLLTMIPVRENSEVVIIYPYIYIYTTPAISMEWNSETEHKPMPQCLSWNLQPLHLQTSLNQSWSKTYLHWKCYAPRWNGARSLPPGSSHFQL